MMVIGLAITSAGSRSRAIANFSCFQGFEDSAGIIESGLDENVHVFGRPNGAGCWLKR